MLQCVFFPIQSRDSGGAMLQCVAKKTFYMIFPIANKCLTMDQFGMAWAMFLSVWCYILMF